MAGGSESSSPPNWAQSLMQQIAQNHARQENVIQAQENAIQAQDERIDRLEALLRSTTTPSEPTPTLQRTTSETIEPTKRSDQQTRVIAHPPRARLPDPAMFAGITTEWPTWRITMENKLSVDGLAIGNDQDQFAYVFSRLEKLAWKNTGTYVKLRRNDGTAKELLDHLEQIYGDPNSQARAARRLHQIRQCEDQPFSKFLPQLEKEFADAGALEWHDEAKRQILLGSLNRTMTNSLMNRGIPATFMGLISRLHEISTDRDALDINRPQRSRHTSEITHDPMDWTPTRTATVSNVYQRASQPRNASEDQQLAGKRAKWVSPDELECRRREGRCFRCGRDGCSIRQCPLLPAKPPQQALQRPRVTTAAVEESNQNASVSTLKKKTSWRSKSLRAATPSHDEESSENE